MSSRKVYWEIVCHSCGGRNPVNFLAAGLDARLRGHDEKNTPPLQLNRFTILGVEAPVWQGGKTRKHPDISSFRNAAGAMHLPLNIEVMHRRIKCEVIFEWALKKSASILLNSPGVSSEVKISVHCGVSNKCRKGPAEWFTCPLITRSSYLSSRRLQLCGYRAFRCAIIAPTGFTASSPGRRFWPWSF